MNRWEKILLGAFLFWGAAGLFFTIVQVSPARLSGSGLPPGLQIFIASCLRWGDPILILLAFANTHVHAARQWGPVRARRWALEVVGGALLIETVGVSTGFPFGSYHYTGRFGPEIGIVPLTIPLAWHVVVTNALFLARGLAPQQPIALQAALTAGICTVIDFILEPFATATKHYWIWQGETIPLRNYVAWFILSGLLAGCLAPDPVTTTRKDWRPSVILGTMLLIFLAGRYFGRT